MLVVNVSINTKNIDTIYIHRLEPLNSKYKEYRYEVVEPLVTNSGVIKWERRIEDEIVCEYGDYKLLLKKVLDKMVENK
jgi:hypothetical protein